ncbi:MAG: HAMP domain-containing histidine kinase [Desulfarculaceae bacterium]|nr:HAMP domain-containing histidine kinase [Desulfarculaceae bacterium]MCF8048608.1 HAMP domain-containing histidine kinase [Desulfarculaceae bacterium]MCF8063865.1 HAMP domain-containing histidine kinase [Desulfarculaceae bacterium]MCF8096543.1 HAMP domain-containing histidine kinase [Desulfarculaceae bacterium]MCF8124205.1 HAMP domain-containing histidine kinase [Desulfarculaceae bacterium]
MSLPDYHTRFLLATSVSQDAVVVITEGKLSYVNPAGESLLSRDLDEIREAEPGQFLGPPPPQLGQGDEAAFMSRVKTAKGPGALVQGLAFGLEDGTQMWVFRENISMAELGSLAAGLLHNLAGPLSVIRSSAEMTNTKLKDLLRQDSTLAESLGQWTTDLNRSGERIINQVDQITATTRDLMAKVNGDTRQHKQPLNLNEILRAEISFLTNDLEVKHGVEMSWDLAPDLPGFKGIYSDFSQALRNIILNAVEATQGQKERKLGLGTYSNQGWVEVSVSDNGPGIAPDVRTHIFEPFFSHGKKSSKAVGLGLHSVRQLLSPYGARYHLESRPGDTVFTVKLPLQVQDK